VSLAHLGIALVKCRSEPRLLLRVQIAKKPVSSVRLLTKQMSTIRRSEIPGKDRSADAAVTIADGPSPIMKISPSNSLAALTWTGTASSIETRS
jgi:hypothetical protein